MGCSPEFGMFGKLDDKGLVFTKGKRIFLQHGIIYNYLPSLVNKKIDLFITSSVKEQDFIINKFNYNKNIVKCTGIARFDDLKSGTGQYILVMPTWRSNLYYMNISDFKKSNYYIKWMEFLNSAKLHEILEEKNLKLMFYPHYETQKFFSKLTTESNRIIFASSHNYSIHELLKNCSMFITDYSSTFFDVGYMHKPILYYQFDYDEFYKTHYEHGYFDIKNDGFGESIRESNELISNLKKIVENEYKTNDIYLKRETDFYKYNDDKNCERIYEEIIKKEGE
jgi:CDP-glycerol glycerophosphotransferase (TagB/SpsB family)